MKVFVACLAICAVTFVCQASQGFSACRDSFAGGVEPTKVTTHADICRDGRIAICYDINMINPAWSAYYVTPEDIRENIPGRDSFYEDPDLDSMGITQGPVDSEAYKGDYNRGHLAPSRIMSNSATAKHSCYTMANVAPQNGYFNQHPWEELETDVFNWIGSNSALHIITGLLYKDRRSPKRSRYDNIAIPDYYFKVICDASAGKSAGFYGDNNGEGSGTAVFRTVREVELMFGGKLFDESTCDTSHVDQSYWWSSKREPNVVNFNRTKSTRH